MSRTRTRRTNVRDKVRLRAEGLCELCGVTVNVHGVQTDPDFPTMHHRWPRRENGVDMVQNLLYLCRHCHSITVHEDEYVARCFGWMTTKDYVDSTPVLCHLGWVYLLEDGSYESLPWWVVEELNLTCGQNFTDVLKMSA